MTFAAVLSVVFVVMFFVALGSLYVRDWQEGGQRTPELPQKRRLSWYLWVIAQAAIIWTVLRIDDGALFRSQPYIIFGLASFLAFIFTLTVTTNYDLAITLGRFLFRRRQQLATPSGVDRFVSGHRAQRLTKRRQ